MKHCVTLFLLFVAGFSQGQTTSSSEKPLFEGRILSYDNAKPLVAATVVLSGSAKKILSNESGHFYMDQLPKGRYMIHITCIGYAELSKEITIPGNQVFHLVALEKELEQVVVTAVTGATKIKRTPVAIAIVSQKEMNRSTSSNVIDALLKSVPGISAITTGPNISKPFIRGLGYNRVLTLYDGIRQEGQQWGDEHGIEIDPYSIARAEIVKGPASLMYGSDAIAGVVNLIPGTPAETHGRIKGDVVTEYHSNNGMIGTTIGLHQNQNGFIWSARASAKQAMNYRNPVEGRVYNTGYQEKNLSLMTGWEKPWRKNYLQLNLYDNLQEIPDGSRDSLTRLFTYQVNEADKDDIRNRPLVPTSRLATYAISSLHQHIQHYRLYHKGIYTIGKGELSTLLGFQQNIRREYNHPTAASQAGLFIVLNTVNYEARYSFPEWKGIRFTYGVNGMYQSNKNKDATDFPIPDYHLFDLGSFLVAKKEFAKTVITAGIRFDNRAIHWNNLYTRKENSSGFYKQVFTPDTSSATLNFPSYHHRFSGVSGSVGLVYTLSNRVTIKANFATGYRSPSIPEIGSDGLDPGAHIYYIGNRNFKPEFNWQADLGLLFTQPNWDATLELFNNRINNYIFFQKLFDSNGQPLEIVPGNFTYQYKQGSARLYGIEANVSIHPKTMPWLSLQGNIASVTGVNTDQETLKTFGDAAKYLPLLPPLRTVARLRINLPAAITSVAETYLQTEIESVATQHQFYAVDNTETKTNGYTLVNVGVGTTFANKKGKNICQLFINANNLFNIAYQSHQNRLKYFEYYNASPDGRSGIYNMGRNVAVKLIVAW
ncbi:MAG: TonB-dependent receptor [Bacteroidota bacterium]